MPAAAVIPAPKVYVKVVAFKKLVVQCPPYKSHTSSGCCKSSLALSAVRALHLILRTRVAVTYFEEIRLFHCS